MNNVIDLRKQPKYNVQNGTSYHIETLQQVINVLERARTCRERIIVHYGDTKTGLDWQDTYGTTGYVGRSTGTNKIPLLVYNARSLGGGGILDHCIVKITTARYKIELYKHPSYHTV